ncbi:MULTISPECIES: thiamine phosphate synthase [Dyella]|uniref:Thiamine-phosphate synthase n=2 Tax=Dyella TaxID=231454 RepID=A0A4R0YJF7_9GAMM|nr:MULTISPECIES: thiamine phosphate synthase [Dyella]TBR36355.1 thiamine phosphate synthase [Dyella terrae]TCI06012.1 thiamine phosphate synthase [Dyella soli]
MPHRFPTRGLYAITDGPRDDLVNVVAEAIQGGARLVQYRDKTPDQARRVLEAGALHELCREHGVPLIINDDVALALTIQAEGVHLGEDDDAITDAREALGPDAIIGVSCYDSLERARDLVAAGADYIAFGAFFPSPTKPQARRAALDLLRQSAALRVPRVAIGGITHENGGLLVDAGADYLAAISAVFRADDVRAAAQSFTDLFPANPGLPS